MVKQGTKTTPDKTGKCRILINALHSKTGGGVTYLRNILPLMAQDNGVDLHLCIQRYQKEFILGDLPGVTIHEIGDDIGFWQLQIREQFEVPRLARRINADVVFSPANYGPIWAPNQVLLIRNALSVAMLERRPMKLAYWALVYLGTALSLSSCGGAIAVSEYAKRSLGNKLLKKFDKRIAVIPHGVAGDFVGKPEKDHDNFILAVSDIYVQKNYEAILRAMSKLRYSHPGLVLKIAGRAIDDYYFQKLKALIEELGIENCVQFLGSVGAEQLAELYRGCRVFVFPSKVETFGNPLLEAMANGAAIACSETAAMPEVLGDTGLYFDPYDFDDLTQKVEKYLLDDALRQTMSKKARKRAEDFTMSQTATRTLTLLKTVAAERA